jgi:hypothetical protein
MSPLLFQQAHQPLHHSLTRSSYSHINLLSFLILFISYLSAVNSHTIPKKFNQNGNIFCFGDELTAGISKKEDPHDTHTPYITTLQTFFPNLSITQSSIYGEFAYHMRKRFEFEFPKLSFQDPSVIVVWGGINDISKHTKVNVTVNHLTAIHEYIRHQNIHNPSQYGGITNTILITIPQLKTIDLNREKRLKVNQRLRQYAAGTNGFVLVLDIENVFRYSKHCGNYDNKKSLHTVTRVHSTSTSIHKGTNRSVMNHDPQCHSVPVNPAYSKYWDRPSFWTMSPQGYAVIGRMVYETLCNQSNTYFLE